ncbi:MAG: OsmC family protein [Pseudomonadota bacterium]
MSVHRATVTWALDDGDFLKRRYSRVHTLVFEGGLEVAGSPSPHIVPAPYSRADAVDPEAAFTASLSACHMLWFLDHAARAGFVVASYCDNAEGTLARNAAGKLAMTRVALRPKIAFFGDPRPTPQEIAALHHAAHADCFIANSVTTEVVVVEGG